MSAPAGRRDGGAVMVTGASGGIGAAVARRLAAEFPEVEVDYCHIDAATIYMVTDPARFDVIVTDNLFGDIITDLAAAVTGGIGTAASGNIDASGTNPSMFEPVHGSAPDIAGQGISNPIGAIAAEVGYNDMLAFSKTFHRYYGMSPTKFRELKEVVVVQKEKGIYISSNPL